MGKKNYYLLLFLALLGTVSCNDSFLDQTATTDLSEESVFADSTYASGFLTDIYANIGFDVALDRYSGGGLQIACDEAESKETSSISTVLSFATGTINPQTVSSDAWETCYKNIRKCNKFMKNIGKAPMNDATKQQYTAEARFLRAWYYYILLRHYGGVPLIGDTLYTADDEVKATRDTYEDCIDYIVSECKAVIDMDVLRPRNTGRSNGRINEACCYALIMRAYLDAASPLHNGSGYGTEETKLLLGYADKDDSRWTRAYNAALTALTMKGDYTIYENHTCDDYPVAGPEKGWGFYAVQFASDFMDCTSDGDFSYPNGPFQEIILSIKKDHNVGTCQILDPPSCGGNGTAGYVYYDLAEAFPMLDGKAIGESKYTYDPLQPANNRDPRFQNTIIYNGLKIYNQGNYQYPIYTYQGDGSTQDAIYNGTPTGLYIRKMLHRSASGNWWIGPPQSHPLIRYAEIMLSCAEACNEAYGPDYVEPLVNDSVSLPYDILKRIRRRAGIDAGEDGLYGLKANMTQDEMREAIRLERRLELAFEGFRFFDVRRWMIADEVENSTMHGLEITRAKDENNKTVYTAKSVDVRKHVFRQGMYFWPLPYAETVKTPDLLQNPYYE